MRKISNALPEGRYIPEYVISEGEERQRLKHYQTIIELVDLEFIKSKVDSESDAHTARAAIARHWIDGSVSCVTYLDVSDTIFLLNDLSVKVDDL